MYNCALDRNACIPGQIGCVVYVGCVCGFCRMGLFTSLLLFSFFVVSMHVCDCLLSVMGRQLDRES